MSVSAALVKDAALCLSPYQPALICQGRRFAALENFVKKPELGEILPAAHPNAEAVKLMRLRRSTPADFLGEPGPDRTAIESILTIAARAPDHRRVTPFRFILFLGEARERFGEALKSAFLANEPEAEASRIEYEKNRFLRAPVVAAVVSKVDRAHRTPEWEQLMTAGAVCQNMLIAASAPWLCCAMADGVVCL